MDMKMIRDEMCRLDRMTGMDTSDVPIRISSRMTRTWGMCRWQVTGRKFHIRELVFAKRLVEHGTAEHITNVIRHEYAHLYVTLRDNKNHGHDAVWKQAALWLGCNAKRCEGFDEIDDVEGEIKYKVTCQGCGAMFKYRRASKIVQELRRNPDSTRFFCRRCNSHSFSLDEVSKS